MRTASRVALAAGVVVMGAAARAQLNTRVEVLLSGDGVNFSSHFQPAAGANSFVEALVRVTYIGTGSPVGLSSIRFQPTVSHWQAQDYLIPLELGVLPPEDQYGRIAPFRRGSISSTSQLQGHVHANGSGGAPAGGWLRIAMASTTGWIGTSGNTAGSAGVNCSQLSNVGRTSSDPAFNPSLSVDVFRFGMFLDFSQGVRPMVFDIPLDGFGHFNASTGQREVHWWGSMNESSASIRGTVAVVPGLIVVPAPWSMVLLGLVTASRWRRR